MAAGCRPCWERLEPLSQILSFVFDNIWLNFFYVLFGVAIDNQKQLFETYFPYFKSQRFQAIKKFKFL